MTDPKRDRGMEIRREVLGDDYVDAAAARTTDFSADFQDLLTRYVWGEVWARPGLDRRTRSCVTLALLAALNRQEELAVHVRGARRNGVTDDEIKEVLLHSAAYCGVPAANTAFKIALDILREEGLEPPPQPLVADVRPSSHDTFSTPQLHVKVQGPIDGMPVMLSHALGLDMGMWEALAGELAATHPVLRYDHRGHGGSAVPPGPYTMGELVDDAARLIREWGRGPVAFIGLSMGGMVGQGLAVRYPELLRGLVLANTTSKYPAEAMPNWTQRIATVEAQGMPGIVETVLERYFHAGFRSTHGDAVAAYRSTVLRCDAQGYVACCHAASSVNWTDSLHTVKVPTLVIAGALDVGAPPAMSRVIAERIEGSQLVVLDDTAHLSVVEQPAAFSTLVREFVDKLD
jgi:3-oxoadipate enol-lactonase